MKRNNSYIEFARRFMNEEDEQEELEVLPNETDNTKELEDNTDDKLEADEEMELDLENPVCPSCGALLIPVGDGIDASEVEDEEEAAAIELLQNKGYIVYKTEEDADEDSQEVEETFEDKTEEE